MKMKAFITMFNRFANVKDLAQSLTDAGCEVYLIDNNSTYSPLLEWYEQINQSRIIRLDKNYLSRVFWDSGLSRKYSDRFYIVTDPDLDISSVPKDFVDVLMNALSLSENVWKAGLSLEINDLPENQYTQKVIEHEKRFWELYNVYAFYTADVATTLALYDNERLPNIVNFLDAVRMPRPYTAKHLDWYKTRENLTEEDLYYCQTTNWKGWLKHLKDATTE
jgi:hypothetical protein